MPEPLNFQEQIEISASLAEGQFREFKSAQEGRPGSKTNRSVRSLCKDVAEALVAFANADGGELILGIEDDGAISGVDGFSEAEIEEIKRAPKTHVHEDTPLQSVLVRIVQVQGKKIIYFRITKGTVCIHLTADGRCLRRNDLQTVPVPAEKIQFERQETLSREYDRQYVDGASVADLNQDLVRIAADQVSPGISNDKCLQYLGLADYDNIAGLRIRRGALLLFATDIDRWHPRVQVRIIRVNGLSLGAGAEYNVLNDITVKSNIIALLEEAWDNLRPHLVATRFQEDAKFRTMYIYPEIACREALVNAIAHRDYSEEGRGIEIYVYDDRIEVQNPGALLSSVSLTDITALRGVHQSRNSYIARALREIGVMRELGEGMRRMFELMKSNELAPPAIIVGASSFVLALHHRAMYSKEELLWLEQYDSLELSPEEKAAILLGRKGDLIAPNDIIRRLGIVDIEQYRKVVASLQTKKVLETTLNKTKAQAQAKKKGLGTRDIPRFRVKLARDINPAVSSSANEVGSGADDAPGLPDPASLDGPTALYVTNIPPNTTSRDLMSAFLQFGQPSNIVIPRDPEGLSRGYAFVELESEAAAAAALDATIALGYRTLLVQRKRPRANGKGIRS